MIKIFKFEELRKAVDRSPVLWYLYIQRAYMTRRCGNLTNRPYQTVTVDKSQEDKSIMATGHEVVASKSHIHYDSVTTD